MTMSKKQNSKDHENSNVSYSQVIGRNLDAINDNGSLEFYHLNYKDHLPQKNKLVIDLGCSVGIFLEYLAKEGFSNIIGVDGDADALNVCRERLGKYDVKQLNIIQADIFEYLNSLSDGSVACIAMTGVIEHFPKEELISVFKEINRVLENGGILIAMTGNIENPLNLGLFLRDFTHHIGFTVSSLFNALVICGFCRNNIIVKPAKFSTGTIKQKIGAVSFVLASCLLKLFASAMRMHINETCKLIYCVAKK